MQRQPEEQALCGPIELPVRRLQTWAALERGMREVLAAAGAPPDMVEAVCMRMHPLSDRLQFSYSARLKLPMPLLATPGERRALHDAVADTFRDLERQLHEFALRVLLERLQTETELYVARQRAG